MLMLCYLLACRPHEDKATHYLEIFNELTLLAVLYFLPLFTDVVPDNKLKFKMGWAFNIMLLVPLFGVNLVHTFFNGVKQSCEEMRAACGAKPRKVIVVAEPVYDDADKFDHTQRKLFKQNLDVVVEELPAAEEYESAVETEAFLQAMARKGLCLNAIQKDGNCVFRSIGLLLFEDQSKHMQVRHDIVNQLKEKRKTYEKNISYSAAIPDFNAYIQNMREEGVWGDHVELQAAADMYGCDINVYTVGTGCERPNMIVECLGEIEYLPISLWFENDNHYHAFTDFVKEEPAKLTPEVVDLPDEEKEVL